MEDTFEHYYHCYFAYTREHKFHTQEEINKCVSYPSSVVMFHIYDYLKKTPDWESYFRYNTYDQTYEATRAIFEIENPEIWYSLDSRVKKTILRYWQALAKISMDYVEFLNNNVITSSSESTDR